MKRRWVSGCRDASSRWRRPIQVVPETRVVSTNHCPNPTAQQRMNQPVRAFVAVKVSDQIATGLIEWQSQLRRRRPSAFVRWSTREQLHITLAFLGNVACDRLPALLAAVGGACQGAGVMHLAVNSLGVFPSPARPRVIWAGLCGDVTALCDLQQRVASATAGFGEHTEEREFHPHVTLGRVSSKAPRDQAAVAEVMRSVSAPQVGHWQAQSVFLIRSRLEPSGAVYTNLGEFPLGAVA